MGFRPWTRREELHAISLRQAGQSFIEIATQLDRTPCSVEKRLRKLGVKRVYRRASELERKLRAACKPGRTDGDVARLLGISKERVIRARHQFGIPAGVSAADSWKFRKRYGSRLRPTPPKVVEVNTECWGCGAPAPRTTAATGDWYSCYHAIAAQRELYCPTCIRLYGTPDQWAPAVQSESSV